MFETLRRRRRLAARLGVCVAGLLVCAAAPSAASSPDPPRSQILSGGWLFQPDPLGIGYAHGWQRPDFDRTGWRSVAVPMAWDFYDPVMDGYEGVGWYALSLPADRVAPGSWQRLRFHRANYKATVWIDGQKAGESLTGYMPFEVAATPMLKPARPAWIVVRVENGSRPDWLPGATVVEWVQYGGLLEPVELLSTPPAYLAHVAIRAEPRGIDARVAVTVEVENFSDKPFAGRVRFETERANAESVARVPPGSKVSVLVELSLPRASLWSPENPALYDARVRLLTSASEQIDSVAERFGVRAIQTKGRQILLNGRALRIRGVNRYDEMPGRGPVATEAAIRADLESVKAAGANLVRTHYPQSPAHLKIADEIGLLFMEEVPLNWWRATFRPPLPPELDDDRIIELAEKTLEQMVRRDGNHPSLVVWSVANECQTSDERGTRAMERLLRRAKTLDPGRLATYVVDRDIEKNRAFAVADFVAVNLYYGMWAGEVANEISEIEARVFAPTRQALQAMTQMFGEKPLVVTEFGTIGIPGSGGDARFSEDYQAAYASAAWRAIESVPEASGGIVWCWADYRHRNGFTNEFPTFFGPFGIVTLDRRPKKAHATLRALWRGTPPAATSNQD